MADEQKVKLCEVDRKMLFLLKSEQPTSGQCAYCRKENAAGFVADMDADEAAAKKLDEDSAKANEVAAKAKEAALAAAKAARDAEQAQLDIEYEAAVAARKASNAKEGLADKAAADKAAKPAASVSAAPAPAKSVAAASKQ